MPEFRLQMFAITIIFLFSATLISIMLDLNTKLPSSSVSVDWIQNTLSKNGAKLIDLSYEMVGIGQGYQSNIFRVLLIWDKNDDDLLLKSIIVKVTTPENIIKGMKNIPDEEYAKRQCEHIKQWVRMAHSNEILALQFLNSTCQKLSLPKLYDFIEYSMENIGQGCILMEDIGNSKVNSLTMGISENNLYQVTATLAGIHAVSLGNDDKLEKLIVDLEFWKSLKIICSGIGDQFQEMDPQYGLGQLCNEMRWIFDYDHVLAARKDFQANGYPLVLVHGDVWTNNILVEINDQQNGAFLSLVDWQTSSMDIMTKDLARLLISSVNGELRRRETDNVLRFYQEELAKKLAELGKINPFTFEVIKNVYDANFPFSVAFFLFAVPIMSSSETNLGENGKTRANFMHSELSKAKMALEDVRKLKAKGRCGLLDI